VAKISNRAAGTRGFGFLDSGNARGMRKGREEAKKKALLVRATPFGSDIE
jgi:hypothetical protein